METMNGWACMMGLLCWPVLASALPLCLCFSIAGTLKYAKLVLFASLELKMTEMKTCPIDSSPSFSSHFPDGLGEETMPNFRNAICSDCTCCSVNLTFKNYFLAMLPPFSTCTSIAFFSPVTIFPLHWWQHMLHFLDRAGFNLLSFNFNSCTST
ncbi:hypothetical protein NC651_014485 [Populus alba x Populus x berolinensis]|nr:hypothetical protein NC651_014485 [Populus alba x Populus x berolinensis]